MSLITAIISLFLVLNALGNIPVFLALLRPYSPKHQLRILVRESLIALMIMLLFGFFGHYVMAWLGISQPIIGIGGGVLLFLISLNMVFPKHDKLDVPKHEPVIVPLATPLFAGPGTIAAVMLYSAQAPHLMLFWAILISWGLSALITLAGASIRKLIGEKVLLGFERLMGLLLTLMAAQMFAKGILQYIQAYWHTTAG